MDSEDEAKAIIADLDAGGDFAAIAKDKSKDPGSAANGGDLGFIKRGETVKAFEDAAFALDVGQYTKTPVQSQFGWHIIKVDEKRPEAPPTFEQEARRIQPTCSAKPSTRRSTPCARRRRSRWCQRPSRRRRTRPGRRPGRRARRPPSRDHRGSVNAAKS